MTSKTSIARSWTTSLPSPPPSTSAPFAQYGVTITPAQETAGQDQAAPDQEPAGQQTEPAADVEVSQEEITSAVDDQEQIKFIIDEVLADPDLAQLPEEERMQLISEVLDEIRAS
jgi:hypothetical protein